MQKEKCDCEYQMLITLVVGLVIGVVIGMAIYAFLYPVFQSENWAAWVQAVGSIGAIAGAVYISKREERIRSKEARDEKYRKDSALINGMYSVAKEAFMHLKRFERSSRASPSFRNEEGRGSRVILWKMQGKVDLKQAIDLVSDIPLHQCPNGLLITGIALFKSNLVALQSEIDEVVLKAMEDPDYNFPIHQFLDLRVTNANKIWDLITGTLEEYYASNISAMPDSNF